MENNSFEMFSYTEEFLASNDVEANVLKPLVIDHLHFRCRVNSSGSQKAAVSNVALRMNISAPVRSSDSAKISKNVVSLVD